MVLPMSERDVRTEPDDFKSQYLPMQSLLLTTPPLPCCSPCFASPFGESSPRGERRLKRRIALLTFCLFPLLRRLLPFRG